MLLDLKTDIWVSALIARAHAAGASAYVVKKGDMDAGSVILKISALNSYSKLFVPSRNLSGEVVFTNFQPKPINGSDGLQSSEIAIDDYIQKRVSQDRDLWVIEIEDKRGRNFLIERVE
jgi:hypothetical protein